MMGNRVELNERQKSILYFIVDRHSIDKNPIGSRLISKHLQTESLSPASIRNVMADLEDMGFLSQPHISAGRIPTDQAYRYYVEDIIRNRSFIIGENVSLREKLEKQEDINDMFTYLSRSLSKYTGYVGIVLKPNIIQVRCKNIRFVRIDASHVQAVFVSNRGMVINRVIDIGENLSQEQLDRMSNIVRDNFRDLPIPEILTRIENMLKEEKVRYDILLRKALELSNKSISNITENEKEILYDGIEQLLDEAEEQNYETMINLYRAFEDKAKLLMIFQNCLKQEGLNVIIGSENLYRDFDSFSWIADTYSSQGRVLGSLAVLGPKNMKYPLTLGIVHYTTQIVSNILSKNGF